MRTQRGFPLFEIKTRGSIYVAINDDEVTNRTIMSKSYNLLISFRLVPTFCGGARWKLDNYES